MVPRSDQGCVPLPGPSTDSQTLPGAPEHTWSPCYFQKEKGPEPLLLMSPARPPAATAEGPSGEGETLLSLRRSP